jgi:hypothetical protein
MHARRAACTALLALAVLTAGCSSHSTAKADIAACKTAMRKQLQDAVAAGSSATPGSRPSQCDGVDAKTLQKLAGDLMAEQVGKAVKSAIPTPSDTADASGITPDCRAWIESELQDSSATIDATSGEDACGYMSQDELNKAIDTVTNDLLHSPTP